MRAVKLKRGTYLNLAAELTDGVSATVDDVEDGAELVLVEEAMVWCAIPMVRFSRL